MLKTQIAVPSLRSLQLLVARLAPPLAQHGAAVFLNGDLGSGKTTFCRYLLREFGYKGIVASPTFTLFETYELELGMVIHSDLYRLQDARELYGLGIEDYYDDAHILLIEWAEKAQAVLPPADVVLSMSAESSRSIEITALGNKGEKIVAALDC